jgi:hypothetical protein
MGNEACNIRYSRQTLFLFFFLFCLFHSSILTTESTCTWGGRIPFRRSSQGPAVCQTGCVVKPSSLPYGQTIYLCCTLTKTEMVNEQIRSSPKNGKVLVGVIGAWGVSGWGGGCVCCPTFFLLLVRRCTGESTGQAPICLQSPAGNPIFSCPPPPPL